MNMKNMAAMALSALLCLTTTGAVAQSYEAKVFDAPASWASDETTFSAADLPEDFVQITIDEAAALAVPDGIVFLIYGFNSDGVNDLDFESGTYIGSLGGEMTRGDLINLQTENNLKICYTAAASSATPAPAGYSVSLKEGTEDATSWQGKAGEGEYQALPLEGVAAGVAVSVKYIGTKKVKSVKAVKKAAPAPAATVTTAPTAKTGVKAGQNEAIVNAGTAEGGTMMYMVNATQPASTEGFSATVPTAEGLTAGTYYVWYYVEADDSHTDSEISATGIEVTIAAVKTLAEATAGDIGMVVCADGHLHDAKTAVPSGCTAVGILGKVTETGHGLILALQDATQLSSWYTINDWTSVTTYAGTTLKQLPDDAARGSLTSYNSLGSTTVSNWCVGQKSDYEAIFTNLGSTSGDPKSYDANVNAYITTGVGGTAMSDRYWPATEAGGDYAWRFSDGSWYSLTKNNGGRLRPVLAF